MLPAWIIDKIKIDKIKKDKEPQVLHIGDEYLDRPALEDGGILQKDDTDGDFSFYMSCLLSDRYERASVETGSMNLAVRKVACEKWSMTRKKMILPPRISGSAPS